MPVVDRAGRLIGRITPRQLRRVLREEAEEHLNLMAGLPADTRPDESVRWMVRGRIPWLLIGLAGASISAAVVGAFEDQLARAAILATFIPNVMSSAGKTRASRPRPSPCKGLANGTARFGDIGWRLGEELVAALANGAIAAVVLFGLVILTSQFTAFDDPLRLALTAGVALLTLITLAVAVGAAVPLILDRVGIDPAMATGVFITTGNDIMAVAVFFLMVTLFYL